MLIRMVWSKWNYSTPWEKKELKGVVEMFPLVMPLFELVCLSGRPHTVRLVEWKLFKIRSQSKFELCEHPVESKVSQKKFQFICRKEVRWRNEQMRLIELYLVVNDLGGTTNAYWSDKKQTVKVEKHIANCTLSQWVSEWWPNFSRLVITCELGLSSTKSNNVNILLLQLVGANLQLSFLWLHSRSVWGAL